MLYLSHEKNENKLKEAGIGPFLKFQLNYEKGLGIRTRVAIIQRRCVRFKTVYFLTLPAKSTSLYSKALTSILINF